MPFQAINPATGETLGRYDEHSTAEAADIVARNAQAFVSWRVTPFSKRATLLRAAAAELRLRSDEYARTITQEMGKPITQSRSEVEKCAWVCDWYAEHAERILAEEPLESDASDSHVRFDPIGPVLAVMPWNFPFWQVFRFAAPALMAGNTCLLKHASNVPGCALMIEEVFHRAGFPQDCFRTLMLPSSGVQAVIEHPAVAAVTLTGSESAGSHVAAAAGKRLKKSVLELGGSDPFIVLGDADIAEAARTGALARMINTGQSCIAAKRFIVTEDAAEEFLAAFVSAVVNMRIGDPMDDATEVGALAREDLLLDLDAQVRASVAQGAEVLTGGRRLDGPGIFYLPTVLGNVQKGMPAFDEETFGPVAAVITVSDEDEAVAVANDSEFGLGASLWTRDRERALRLLPRIEAGSVFVNGLVKSDPRLPFGGIKRSGYGRELSHYGIREFVNIKTVWIK
ncbi:MAG: NAD-dependent succinate-semialdehyde dehydrogenase [Bacteroidetes bacterium]|nr:NAD-dependent succinate-semialdehyde dehydrogenase [Bacteroidota bacterium]